MIRYWFKIPIMMIFVSLSLILKIQFYVIFNYFQVYETLNFFQVRFNMHNLVYTHRSVKAVEYMVRIKKILLELQWDWCFVILFIFSFHCPTFQIEFCYFIIPSLSFFSTTNVLVAICLILLLSIPLSFFPSFFLSFLLSFFQTFKLSLLDSFYLSFFLSFYPTSLAFCFTSILTSLLLPFIAYSSNIFVLIFQQHS